MRRSSRIKKLKTEEDAPPPTASSPSKIGKGCSTPVGLDDSSASNDEPVATTSSGAGTGAPTPLENAVILNHLFQFCNAQQLANCRLVCKQWYEESLLIWRSSFRITLKETNGGKGLPAQKFLAYCADPQNKCSTKPYRSIKIANSKFTLEKSAQSQSLQLTRALGSNITSLHLFQCVFKPAGKFREIIFGACPHLQTLKIQQCTIQNIRNKRMYKEPPHPKNHLLKSLQVSKIWYEPLPISWLELFSHFPALTHFSYESEMNFVFEHDQFKGLTDAIRHVREDDPKALPFKVFELDPVPNISPCGCDGCDPATQTQLGLLEELRLTFKSLRIDIDPEMNQAGVKNVLEYQAGTVTEIMLTGTATGLPGQAFPFGVQLDKLTFLDVYEDDPLGNLTFLKFTPNLKKLVIRADADDHDITIISNSCKQEMANVRMAQLEEFRLEGELTDQDLASLFEWMPNITSLDGLTLTDKQFGMVCGSWGKLKCLTVQGYELTDGGVTGMTNLGGEKQALKKEVTQPNITNLQNLEEFSFRSWQIGDDSVFNGLLELPHLRRVSCYGWRWTSLGEDARKALEARNIHVGR